MTRDFHTLLEQAPAAARRIEAIAQERIGGNEPLAPDPDYRRTLTTDEP